jgi:hypothetical protein
MTPATLRSRRRGRTRPSLAQIRQGEWAIHFGGEPEFAEQASRVVLIVLAWFWRRTTLPRAPCKVVIVILR